SQSHSPSLPTKQPPPRPILPADPDSKSLRRRSARRPPKVSTMKRQITGSFIAVGLLFALASPACVEPPNKKSDAAATGAGGEIVTMDQVDDSMNSLITGDRYQITYEPNDLWKGAPNGALVTIVEYSDFQCPYCVRLTDSLKKIAEEYPDDVRIVFKHFPLPRAEERRVGIERSPQR